MSVIKYGFVNASQIVAETEKAYKFKVLVETFKGKFIQWNIWLPKSVLEKCHQFDNEGETVWELSSFALSLLEGRLPSDAKEIR